MRCIEKLWSAKNPNSAIFSHFFLEKIKKTYKFAMSYLIMGNHIQKVRHYINKGNDIQVVPVNYREGAR